jgi:signal transduction histidine kinase
MEEKEDIERVDFEKILQQLSQSFKSDLNKHSIRASHQINLTADFWGNEEIIQTIMENIFENAIQYFDDKKTERWIKTEITNSDQQLLIQIMDNGVGIETELQSRIFDMYFKDNEKSKGNGLGLYVTRKLVKKLHGKISIWSTVCEGTIFIVKLPLVSAGV